MDGEQKTVVERLEEIVLSVKEGKYGKDDDLDVEALRKDLEEALDDM